jgi:serine/threonine protein kinase
LDPNNEEFDSIIIGQTFNQIYNVESKIGHGGFAHVYLVNDLNKNIKYVSLFPHPKKNCVFCTQLMSIKEEQ